MLNLRPGAVTLDQLAEIWRTGCAVRLDDAARATVLRWKFVPARRGSEPVPAWVLIPISFRLES